MSCPQLASDLQPTGDHVDTDDGGAASDPRRHHRRQPTAPVPNTAIDVRRADRAPSAPHRPRSGAAPTGPRLRVECPPQAGRRCADLPPSGWRNSTARRNANAAGRRCATASWSRLLGGWRRSCARRTGSSRTACPQGTSGIGHMSGSSARPGHPGRRSLRLRPPAPPPRRPRDPAPRAAAPDTTGRARSIGMADAGCGNPNHNLARRGSPISTCSSVNGAPRSAVTAAVILTGPRLRRVSGRPPTRAPQVTAGFRTGRRLFPTHHAAGRSRR